MSGTMKFTDSPEQAAVIQAPSYEDVVVVAGAGSGKTYTMTRRIITLIEQGVSPEKILGLTFTRKAASELLSRVSAAVSRNQRERGLKSANMTFLKPEVSTYDAFFPIHCASIRTACRLRPKHAAIERGRSHAAHPHRARQAYGRSHGVRRRSEIVQHHSGQRIRPV